MRRPAALASLLLSACASTPPETEPALWAGVARVEITPTRAVPLGGYGGRKGKPLTGVHDPVFAKALWLETKRSRVCIVTTDLIGSTREIRDRIKPADADVILAASHTHSGPGGLAKGIWQLAMGKYDEDLYEEMAEKLSRVVREARTSRRPARLGFAKTAVPELCRNRRSDDGPVDPELNVLLVADGTGRPMAVLANYTAHGTVLPDKNFLVSADWPGAFQRALEEELRVPVLYTNGAEGDIAPRSPGGKTRFEQSGALGRALARRAANLARGIENTREEVRITYVERGVDLPSPTLPVVVPKKAVLGVLRIDDVRFFCFPGEPIVELGLALKRRFPGAWVLGLANDHLGYFLTEEEYAKGGYERRVSFYGPKLGALLVERFEELGEGEHAEDRAGQPERRRRKNHHRR